MSTSPTPDGVLKPTLSVFDVVAITVSAVTPASSVFVIAPFAIQQAGSGVFLAFVMAGLLALMFAFCYAELGRASISDLQIATLILAYAVMAFCGLRQFYRHKALDARADGPATDLSRMVKAVPGDDLGLVVGSGGVVVQRATWNAALPRYLVRAALLLLFCASLMKLSAQSYSPFLYFQF